jgi:VanZ family protein
MTNIHLGINYKIYLYPKFSKLYKTLFWTGYFAVFITAFLALPWQLDKIHIGAVKFYIRLDHLLHLAVYFTICLYFLVGQRKELHLFRNRELRKFFIFLVLLATFTEVVQLWVPSRSFNPMDWIANMEGIGIGYFFIVILKRSSVVSPKTKTIF